MHLNSGVYTYSLRQTHKRVTIYTAIYVRARAASGMKNPQEKAQQRGKMGRNMDSQLGCLDARRCY